MTELKHTAALMLSDDYKERFMAEHLQLKIRLEKLKVMCQEWEAGRLKFVPTCPRGMYDEQIEAMTNYLKVLENRAKLENIDLSAFNDLSKIQEVKLVRKELASIIGDLTLEESSFIKNQAICRLKEGSMWLGLQLRDLGSEYPYPNGINPANNIVDPENQKQL